MSMLQTFISISGLAASGYSVVNGVAQANRLDVLENKIDALGMHFERISDSIIFVPKARLITDISKSVQKAISQESVVTPVLERVQDVIEMPIASSQMIQTPEKMQAALSENPWDVLIDIAPYHDCSHEPRNGMVPILFEFQSLPFIGWQLAGALKALFGIEYNSEKNMWLSASAFSSGEKVHRNSKCPCGFGDRFKQCCGRLS